MVKENNGWFCTDPDCMQHCKKINDTEFKFIHAVWLDTCHDDPKAENRKNESDNYAVCADYIDIELYSEKDIECALAPYGYDIEFVKDAYGEDMNQIIAECLFEENCLYDSSSISGVVSWNDAEKTIQNYIDER